MLNNTIRESTKKPPKLVSYSTKPLLATQTFSSITLSTTQLQEHLAPTCWACLQVLTGGSLTHSSWKTPLTATLRQADRPSLAHCPHLSRPGPLLPLKTALGLRVRQTSVLGPDSVTSELESLDCWRSHFNTCWERLHL